MACPKPLSELWSGNSLPCLSSFSSAHCLHHHLSIRPSFILGTGPCLHFMSLWGVQLSQQLRINRGAFLQMGFRYCLYSWSSSSLILQSHKSLKTYTVFVNIRWQFATVSNHLHGEKLVEWIHGQQQYMSSWNLGSWPCVCHVVVTSVTLFYIHDQMNARECWARERETCVPILTWPWSSLGPLGPITIA